MYANNSPPMLVIFYWLVLFLWVIGLFVPPNPIVIRATNGVLLALFIVIGIKLFGNPLH